MITEQLKILSIHSYVTTNKTYSVYSLMNTYTSSITVTQETQYETNQQTPEAPSCTRLHEKN